MLPLVIDELRCDLDCFGRCTYSVTDTVDEFTIRRYDPTEYFYTLETY
jgi:hypothetical protein